MASISQNAIQNEPMDDMFDYDINYDDLDLTIPDPQKTPPLRPASLKTDELGLEEEVVIKKKRVIVNLDENRLLSYNGIPKLRKEASKKLRFKGKGHEYKDAGRLLAYYQLWADEMFKKGKFRDTLQIIEKLGHSKSMKNQRKEWIYEDVNALPKTLDIDRAEKGEKTTTSNAPTVPTTTALSVDDDNGLYIVPVISGVPISAVSRIPDTVGSIFSGNAAGARTPPPLLDDPNALFKGAGVDIDSDDMVDDAEIAELMESQKAIEQRQSAAATMPVMPPLDAFDAEMQAMGDMSFMDD